MGRSPVTILLERPKGTPLVAVMNDVRSWLDSKKIEQLGFTVSPWWAWRESDLRSVSAIRTKRISLSGNLPEARSRGPRRRAFLPALPASMSQGEQARLGER
jgi:hypothetical protein